MQASADTDYDGRVGQEFSPCNGADWATSLEAACRVCDVYGRACSGSQLVSYGRIAIKCAMSATLLFGYAGSVRP